MEQQTELEKRVLYLERKVNELEEQIKKVTNVRTEYVGDKQFISNEVVKNTKKLARPKGSCVEAPFNRDKFISVEGKVKRMNTIQ